MMLADPGWTYYGLPQDESMYHFVHSFSSWPHVPFSPFLCNLCVISTLETAPRNVRKRTTSFTLQALLGDPLKRECVTVTAKYILAVLTAHRDSHEWFVDFAMRLVPVSDEFQRTRRVTRPGPRSPSTRVTRKASRQFRSLQLHEVVPIVFTWYPSCMPLPNQLIRCRPKLNASGGKAPTHVESQGLPSLCPERGSRMAKGTLKSGYSKLPFFAPKEARDRASGNKPPAAAREQKAKEAAAARRRAPSTPAPRKHQHGAAAALALIGTPNSGPPGRPNGKREPLPLVAGFDKPRNSKIRWSSPIKNDEDLNGRRKLPPASALPGRSGLRGGRAGRPVPDTRQGCAQTGLSGEFSSSEEGPEDQETGEAATEGSELARLSAAEAAAPANGSPLERLPDSGASPENNELGKIRVPPQGAVVPTATVVSPASVSAGPPRLPDGGRDRGSGETSKAASGRCASGSSDPEEIDAADTATPSCDHRVRDRQRDTAADNAQGGSPSLQSAECIEENLDEEQGRELMMSMMAGGPGERGQTPTTNMVADGPVSEEDEADLGGEEEQGRELMMRMFSGGDPAAVSPPTEVEDSVPPSPHTPQSDHDGHISSSSGENEGDEAMSFAKELPPPVTTVAWRTPKKTVVGGGGGGGGGTSNSASCDSDHLTASVATTAHKPKLSLRSFTRFSDSGAAPAAPVAAVTAPFPISYERPPQLPIDHDTHGQLLADAPTVPLPPNPPRASNSTVRQVVWRNPRQTAAVSSSYPEAQQDNEVPHSACQADLPPEVAVRPGADAMHPPAVPAVAVETPPISWRTPGRSGGVANRLDNISSCSVSQEARRHEKLRAASSSPLLSSSSRVDVESNRSDEQGEPLDRGIRVLLPFGWCRQPNERHSIPPNQLETLPSNAARPTATSEAVAMRQRREEDHRPNGRRPSVSGEHARRADEGLSRSMSSRSNPRERSSSSSSRSSTSRQRRPDYTAREEYRSHRDGRSRWDERDGYDHGNQGSSLSSSNRYTGAGGRMVGYHGGDSGGLRDDVSRHARGGRYMGGGVGGDGGGGGRGYGHNRDDPNRDPFSRDDRNEGRGDGPGFNTYRGRNWGGDGGCGRGRGRDHGSVDWRHGRDHHRSESRHGRSRSPQR